MDSISESSFYNTNSVYFEARLCFRCPKILKVIENKNIIIMKLGFPWEIKGIH